MKIHRKILTAILTLAIIAGCFIFPASAAADDVLFSDDFSGTLNPAYKAGASTANLKTAEIVDGTLRFYANGNTLARTTTYLLYEVPATETDYTIYADFNVAAFGDGTTVGQRARPVGIGFHLPDSTDKTWQAQLFTGVADSNVKLSGYQAGANKTAYNYLDSTLVYPIEQGSWYQAKIIVNETDNIISTWVKAKTATQWSFCYSESGKSADGVEGFGRYVGVLNRGNDVYIDNFKVVRTSGTGAVYRGCQSSPVTAANEYSFRFVSTLDSLNYSEIGYKIDVAYEKNGSPISYTKNYDTTQVYGKIIGSTETGVTEEYTAEALGGEYIIALTVTKIPVSAGEISFTVTPYTIAAGGGEKVYSDATVITVNAGTLVSQLPLTDN